MIHAYRVTEGFLCRSGPPHTDIAQSRKFLASEIRSPNRGISNFVLVLNSASALGRAGTVIGKAGIWSSTSPEIGFMLRRSFWGKGYMAEVFDVLLPHLWAQGVERIIADVDPRNEGSIGLLKRFGFVETRYEKNTIETHLGWCDSVYLEVQRPK